ncbi:MAG TPA: hypothetical protein VFI03_10915, partial [Solirubrobacterales bacterium]|nr:hypothetical protein [Solirubrobacterales bacterium]
DPPEQRSRYEVKQLVIPGSGGAVTLPQDGIAIRGLDGDRGPIPERSEGFDACWLGVDRDRPDPDGRLGLIELGGAGVGAGRRGAR